MLYYANAVEKNANNYGEFNVEQPTDLVISIRSHLCRSPYCRMDNKCSTSGCNPSERIPIGQTPLVTLHNVVSPSSHYIVHCDRRSATACGKLISIVLRNRSRAKGQRANGLHLDIARIALKLDQKKIVCTIVL